MIERLLAKAHRALATAEQDLANGDPDAVANRCYYAVTKTPSDKAASALDAARGFLATIEHAIVKTP